MHKQRKEKVTSPVITLGDDGLKLRWLGLVVGAVFVGAGLLVSMLGGGGFARFSHGYLVNFCYFASISIGSLFFVAILYLTRAGWGVTLRRIAEFLAIMIFPMLILFLPILIPVLLGYDGLYIWNSADWYVADNEKLPEFVHASQSIAEMKAGFLNRGFFGVRAVLYFAIWGAAAWYFRKNSLAQDVSGDKKMTLKSQAFSAPFMILFAATLVFASFDWMMSLEPMWFSTMFPVYFFAGSTLGALAMITLVALMIQRSGRVTSEITIDNYHDMAKLMFSFVIFWGYIAFSQFMLIWYANIPEETFWYRERFTPAWIGISALLLFGHLFIPFLAIMARTVRRNKNFLMFASIYLLLIHWIDIWWIVMPSYGRVDAIIMFPIVEILLLIGMSAWYMSLFCFVAGDRPLVPVRDPWLPEALNYENP
jgi:hypothetical protein